MSTKTIWLSCLWFYLLTARIPLLWQGCIYTPKATSFLRIFRKGPFVFVNTKENMPSKTFCTNFSQEGVISSIPLPDYHICIAFSISATLVAILVHRHMAIFLPYGHLLHGIYAHLSYYIEVDITLKYHIYLENIHLNYLYLINCWWNYLFSWPSLR